MHIETKIETGYESVKIIVEKHESDTSMEQWTLDVGTRRGFVIKDGKLQSVMPTLTDYVKCERKTKRHGWKVEYANRYSRSDHRMGKLTLADVPEKEQAVKDARDAFLNALAGSVWTMQEEK